jgi:hypothetical protein
VTRTRISSREMRCNVACSHLEDVSNSPDVAADLSGPPERADLKVGCQLSLRE